MSKPTQPTVTIDLSPVYTAIDAVQSKVDTATQAISGLGQRITALETPPVVLPPVLPPPPATGKPVALCDMARNYYYWPNDPQRAQAYQWLGQHLDLTEYDSDEVSAQLLAQNPKMKRWLYKIDLTTWTTDARAAALPDRLFILNADGTRKVGNIYNGTRWYYDYSKQETRDVQAAWLKGEVANHDGLLLDEHQDIGPLKGADIAAWLGQLRQTIAPKFVMPNLGQVATWDDYYPQAIAAGGVSTEWAWSLNQGGGWYVGVWAKLIKTITDGGGLVHCVGWWDGPGGVNTQWTRQASITGDWNREAMARLAMYWLVKAPGVYLDLQLYPMSAVSGVGADDLSFSTWFDALRVDLGAYVGPIAEPQTGTLLGRQDFGVHGSPGGFHAFVHAAEYEHARVYVRTQDGYDATTYNATTAVTIPVSGRVLQIDGTVGAAVTSIQLRNADSAIVMK